MNASSDRPVRDGISTTDGECRRHGRIRCAARVRCSNGYVLDLSASGARLQWLRQLPIKQDDVFKLIIEGVDGNISLDARLVWKQRMAWRRYEIGVEFTEVDDDQRRERGLLVRKLMAGN